MPIRSDRIFSVGETSAPMDPSLKNKLMMDRRSQEFRDQADANCRKVATRLERLQTNRKRITEENESRNNSSSHQPCAISTIQYRGPRCLIYQKHKIR